MGLIALPIAFVLLFVYGFRDNLFYGVAIIVGELTTGNILSAIGTICYLLWRVDWNAAVEQSRCRGRSTMKDYHSTKVYDLTMYSVRLYILAFTVDGRCRRPFI